MLREPGAFFPRDSAVADATKLLSAAIPWTKVHGYHPLSLTRQMPSCEPLSSNGQPGKFTDAHHLWCGVSSRGFKCDPSFRAVPANDSNIGLRGAHRVDTTNCCQGLWSVDEQTPPGPEGSNGSLIRAAAVLWQHFLPCDGC